MEDNKKSKKRIKFIAVLKLSILAAILILIPLYIYFYQHDLLVKMADISSVEKLLLDYKKESALFYIAAQVVQIIICIIPGQALQIAAGYLYGFWFGFLLSIAGAAIGSTTVYYLSRILGHDALHLLFGKRKITKAIDDMNSKKGMIITFIIFLIPGLPKDLCSYAAGLSNIKLRPYLIISLIARSPGMMCSLAIGKQVMDGEYTSAIIIAVIVIITFLFGLKFKDKITEMLNRAYDKLIKM